MTKVLFIEKGLTADRTCVLNIGEKIEEESIDGSLFPVISLVDAKPEPTIAQPQKSFYILSEDGICYNMDDVVVVCKKEESEEVYEEIIRLKKEEKALENRGSLMVRFKPGLNVVLKDFDWLIRNGYPKWFALSNSSRTLTFEEFTEDRKMKFVGFDFIVPIETIDLGKTFPDSVSK